MTIRLSKTDAYLQNAPWEGASHGINRISNGRPHVVVSADVERVASDNFTDHLPQTSAWQDQQGNLWKRFELPTTARQADASDAQGVQEELRLIFDAPFNGDWQSKVILSNQLPRLSGQPDSSPDEIYNGREIRMPLEWAQAAELVEELVDRHIDIVNDLYDLPSVTKPFWRGKAEGMAFRGTAELSERWLGAATAGEPRMALIVRLAQKLPDLLSRTCMRPRHTLRRERQMQFLGRIQEVDSSCLRWLARQPGRTLAEKAGVKQLALGVFRVEDVDTPENRVVRDLLIRAGYACDRYLREHRSAEEHPRVALVKRFQSLLRRLAITTPISQAAPLVGIPQPNYVLLHDARYQIIWKAYLQLVRQQLLEDHVWRWRNRVFAEHFVFALIAVLQLLSRVKDSDRGDVLVAQEQNAGQFCCPLTMLGSWRLLRNSDEIVDLVLGCQLSQHPMAPRGLAALGPDAVLIQRTDSGLKSISAFWTMLEFDLAEPLHQNRVASLASALARLECDCPVRALLVQPALSGGVSVSNASTQDANCRGIQIELPLQNHLDRIVEQVLWALIPV